MRDKRIQRMRYAKNRQAHISFVGHQSENLDCGDREIAREPQEKVHDAVSLNWVVILHLANSLSNSPSGISPMQPRAPTPKSLPRASFRARRTAAMQGIS